MPPFYVQNLVKPLTCQLYAGQIEESKVALLQQLPK